MRGAALDEDPRLEPGEAASGIKCRTGKEAGIQQQERIGGKFAYFDVSARSQAKGFVASSKKIERGQRKAPEFMIFSLNGLQKIDGKMQLSAFQLCKRFGAYRLAQFDLHIRKACRIAVQERRKYAIDHLRGCR